jgi:hypothetical protein
MKNILKFTFEITNPDKFLFYKLSHFIRIVDYYPSIKFNLQLTKFTQTNNNQQIKEFKEIKEPDDILKQCQNEMSSKFYSEIKEFIEEEHRDMSRFHEEREKTLK